MRSRDAPNDPFAWSVEDSAELYQVNAWGKGYFCVNAAGHLVVRPRHERRRARSTCSKSCRA